MRVGILGSTEVRGPDGREVAVPGPRARALLAVLALEAGRTVTTTRLIDAVYGDTVPANAANALQSQISRLRQALRAGPLPDPIEFRPGGYLLAVEPDDVDAHRFTRLAGAGRAALAGGDPQRAAGLLREATALWRGSAMADAPLAAGAAALEELRLDAVEDLCEARLRGGEHGGLVGELRTLAAAHPLRERLHGQLVRALHGAGRTAEALAAYEDARRVVADELGVDPSPELSALHLTVLRGERQARQRSGPPAQLTSFVGRDDELKRVGELLDQARLVTLTGPGGTGKTRLAIETATRSPVPGETCFVEFAPLSDPADVPQATLAALGLRDITMPMPGQEPASASPVERLITALAERPMLLVFDNCEHVVDAAARLVDVLLAACPSLRVLATSREPLAITGEMLLPMSGLRAAPEGTALARALDYPAVRLFADRAVAGRADFTLDEATITDVLRVCDALDGLPLAIELAAARIRSLSVGELASRLDDRFSLLSRGSRTAAARHRTLRGVVEWSWDLLDDAERELAARLTVFAGGVTLEAADRVCRPRDTLDVLASLVDKSLVESAGGRYRMLQTIHAFCAERLAETSETGAIRRAHAEYFLELADTASPHLLRAEQLDWLARLDPEHDNMHAALRWAIDEDVDLGLRLANALVPYWWLRGRRSEGSALTAELAVRLGTRPPDGLADEYAMCVLNAVFDPPEDVRLNEQLAAAERIVQSWTAPPRQPFITVLHAVVVGPPDTQSVLRTRLDAIVGHDPWTAALAPMGVGMLDLYRGDFEAAHEKLTDALARFRQLGERWGLSMVLGALGQLEGWRGHRERALELIDEAIGLTEQLGATQETADLFSQRAEAQLVTGRLDGARTDYERSAELARRAGSVDKSAVAKLGLATLALGQGDLDQAEALANQVVAGSPPARFELEETRTQGWNLLGRVAVARGEDVQARTLYRRALAASLDGPTVQTAASALDDLAGLAYRGGDPLLAARLAGAASARRGTGLLAGEGSAELRTALRGLLGDDVFGREHASGEALDETGIRLLAGLPGPGTGNR